MPEIAAVYLAGLVVCLALTVVFVWLRNRRRRSDPFIILQANLSKAGRSWSENQDALVAWDHDNDELDRKSAERSTWITGGLLSLLSWPGVFVLLTVMISFRFLARSRQEIHIFSSPLASDPYLTEADVRRILEELEQTSMRASSSTHLLP